MTGRSGNALQFLGGPPAWSCCGELPIVTGHNYDPPACSF